MSAPPGLAGARGSRARGERGSTLATLALVIAVMSIMLTVASQEWSRVLQREKEKELIFRGERILAAIEEFQSTGRSITKLEDLTKPPKRALRSVPPEPMTARFDEDGELLEGTGQWNILRAGNPGATGANPRAQEDGEPVMAPAAPRGSRIQTGPIRGVASPSEEESIGAYGEIPAATPYAEWKFETATMAQGGVPAPNRQRPERPLPPGFAGLRVPGGPPVQGAQAQQPQQPPTTRAPGGPRTESPGGRPSQPSFGPRPPRPEGRRP